MKKRARLPLAILIGLLITCSIGFPRTANAAESMAAPAESFSQEKDALILKWESADKAFTAALSAFGASKDDLNRYVDQRKSLSDQATAWNKKVSQAGLFLPRLSFDVSEDRQKVKDCSEFAKKAANMEKAADRPMDMEKADTLSSEIKTWLDEGRISVDYFVAQAAKIETRGRENADLACRLMLAADQLKAQDMFDKNSARLKKYLTQKKFSTVRGIVFGYASRERAGELLASAAENPAININAAEIRSDSAAKAQARAKQAVGRAQSVQNEKDRVEHNRIVFLTYACATFDSLKDPKKVKEAADQFLSELEGHNADSDDGKVLEARRDKRIKEIAAQAEAAQKAEVVRRAEALKQAKAAQEAEAARRAEALEKAKAAAEAQAARQKAEDQRRRILADIDAAITAKHYEEAGTLVKNYRAAGGDTALAGQKMNRIVAQRSADMEAATKLLMSDLQDAQRRALGAAKTSDIKAEEARISAIPAQIKPRGADSLKVVTAVTAALKRVGGLWVFAQQGDSLKAAWDQTGKLLAQAMAVSGASKEELQKYAADRSHLSMSAKDWNKKVSQNEGGLPRLGFDATRDAQDIRAYLDFSAKVAAVKKEAARPMSLGKADTLLVQIQALAKNERTKIEGADSIATNIKTQIRMAVAKTDSLITATMAADPLKAQEILNRNSFYLERFGTADEYSALRAKIRVQIQAHEITGGMITRISDFRSQVGKADVRRAQAMLPSIDSLVGVLKALGAHQAQPYSDTLKALQAALEAKKSELVALAKRAEDSLLVLEKQKETLRIADSTRMGVFKSAKFALYKVRNSAQVDSIMHPYLETLGGLQADKFNPAAMKDLKQQITEYTRDLALQEKAAALEQAKAAARAEALEKAKAAAARAEALEKARAVAQARADSLAKVKAEALAQAKAAEQARADSLAKVKAEALAQAKVAAQARADSLAKVKAEALAQAKVVAQARADSLAKARAEAEAKAAEQAKAEAQARAVAQAKADSLAKVKAEALAQAKAAAQAKADSLAKAKAEALAQAKAAAQTRADSLAKAKAEALAQSKAAAQARADSLAKARAETEAKAAEQARADSLANAMVTDSVRMARADSLMANAYPALSAVQSMAEMQKIVLPIIESMKALKVDAKDVQDFRDQVRIKKHELDSLAKLNSP